MGKHKARYRIAEQGPPPAKLDQHGNQYETPVAGKPAPYRTGVTPGKSPAYKGGKVL